MNTDERYAKLIHEALWETARALESFLNRDKASLLKAARLVADSMNAGGKLLLCGNGGSAADCQHLAAEFVCRLSAGRDRCALPALALTTDTSFLTAFSNDYAFADIFLRQVQAFGKPGDVLLGISTSGSSENVLKALRGAKSMGLSTITLTGRGGVSGKIADVSIEVDSQDTAVIQNVHLAVEHALCLLVEEMLLAEGEKPAYGEGVL